MGQLAPTLDRLRTIVETAQSAGITFLAAGVAYYAFVSLIPLTILTLAIGSVMGGEVFEGQIIEFVGEFLTPEAQETLVEALTAQAGRGGATVVGSLVLFWSALRLFRGLDRAFSQVYGTSYSSLVSELLTGAAVLASIVIGVAAVTIVGTAIGRLPLGPFGAEIATALLLVTLLVVFFPLYFVMPGMTIAPQEAVPGTVVAAIGWMLLGQGFQLYTAYAADFAAYGILGGVLLLLTWLYFGALIVMVGAVINAVMAEDVVEELVGPDKRQPDNREETATGQDRQLQRDGVRRDTQLEAMTDDEPTEDDEEDRGVGMAGPGPEEAGIDADSDEDVTTGTAPRSEVQRLNRELAELREQLDEFEDDIEDRTVDRDSVENDLKRYVRRRIRRGHARGWGPYLVLLYGTAMTIGAFVYLDGGWAILAMLVLWLSTLGLYVLMMLVTTTLNVLGIPGRLRNAIGDWRS
ncbi:YihY/virulence factor BrkB family protein [Natranaeroarchaeum sulfidigenes]|uniref:Ribonuclease BN family enzyme n=1 Tax=Natranaeroarchaeum sulfidigenes TaxID=2784880 RepID=A0A897MPX5_9EURY|nr:YihY/virulence factor BrkB family protein [Natranaeroarchaeum sulfidigenes]QSG04210.1 Ribonuclease BN family enzyme [Natranaeroarchaeum sulfidigenes]